MTDEELKAIEERAEAGAEYSYVINFYRDHCWHKDDAELEEMPSLGDEEAVFWYARKDIPKLVAEVRRLRAEVDFLRMRLDE